MYLYVSTSCKIASLYNGEYSHSESNLFQGDAPSQLIIGFVSSEAFSGNYKKSPFNFQPFDCNLWPCTSTDNRTRPNRNNPTSPEKTTWKSIGRCRPLKRRWRVLRSLRWRMRNLRPERGRRRRLQYQTQRRLSLGN